MTEYLHKIAAEAGFQLNEGQFAAFEKYAAMLVEWNGRMNLTAITEPEEIAVKHFLDSMMLLRYAELRQSARLIDVGTGAGFPAIPVKILREDLRVTLLDSLNKRVTFLQAVSEALGQDNACLHTRAEEGGRRPELRERFDCATARAVASLRVLAEYCLPYVRVGGVFAALKGPEIEAELAEAKPAIKALGGKIQAVETYELPGGQGRSIVLVQKISQISTKYPRYSTKIMKEPIK